MNDFDHELRTLLTDRVRETPDMPADAAATVRRRARRMGRQRTGAALGAVLAACAVGSLTFVATSQDPHRSASPRDVTVEQLVAPVSGAEPVASIDSDLPHSPLQIPFTDGRDTLLVLRCAQRGGSVSIEGKDGSTTSLTCDQPSGQFFEGRRTLTARQDETRFGVTLVHPYTARVSGAWRLDVFRIGLSEFPNGSLLVDGRAPEPHRGAFDVPVYRPNLIAAECLGRVRLTVLLNGQEIGTIDCEAERPVLGTNASQPQGPADLGQDVLQHLPPGTKVSVEVRATEEQTKQWRLLLF